MWSTIGGDSKEGEDAQEAFARVINKLLNLKLKPKNIHPIYDYFHDEREKTNFVFYAEVKNSKKFDSFNGYNFSWVAFVETSKIPFTPHSKQDIIVGERVINAKWRDDEAIRESSLTTV